MRLVSVGNTPVAIFTQKALEELAVLVEVFYKVVVVGARALHELVEVARRVLLGLRARMISRGDQHGVVRSVEILLVLFPLCVEGPSS